MATIPLPELHTAPIEAGPSPLQQYAQIMGIKNAQQELQQRQALAPLQQQAAQQEAQSGQLNLQQQQQAQQDQQAFRAAMQQPENHGKTIGDIADTLADKGQISPQSWAALKKTDVEQRTSLATLTQDQLNNAKGAHEQTQALYSNVMNMPDEQLAANWPSIAQQYDAIPGNQKMPLDPAKPMTKDQLQQFGPMISMHGAYLDEALKRQQAQQDLEKARIGNQVEQQQLAMGGNQQLADSRYRFIETRRSLGEEPSPEDAAFEAAYKKQKLMVPQATAQVRIEGMGQTREYPVFDNQTKTTTMMNANDLNAARQKEPGRYTVPGYTPEAIGEKGTTEYFTKGAGGKQITAFNTAMSHLDVLDGLADKLNNSDLQIFNKAAQTWKEQTGNPAPANFDAARNAMSGEVAAALKASGATDQEIAQVGSTFSRAQSPEQLHGAIDTYRTLLNGKLQNLKEQYKAGMQGQPNFGGAQPQQNGPGQQNQAAPTPTKITLPSGKQIVIE